MLTPGLLPWLAIAGGLGALLRHLVVRALTTAGTSAAGSSAAGSSAAGTSAAGASATGDSADGDSASGDSAPGSPPRPAYPLGTTVVNLIGAAAGGVILGVALSGEMSGTGSNSILLTVLSVGLLGAFTTFSSWMTEVEGLREDGRPVWATLHLLGVLVAGLFLAAAGFWITLLV